MINWCHFEEQSDGQWKCSKCQRLFPVKANRHCIGEGPHPEPPPIKRQVWNLAKSLAAFASDGCKLVTADQYAARLAICDPCQHRRNTRCLKCGCSLALKARVRAFECPQGHWEPLLPRSEDNQGSQHEGRQDATGELYDDEGDSRARAHPETLSE